MCIWCSQWPSISQPNTMDWCWGDVMVNGMQGGCCVTNLCLSEREGAAGGMM